MKQLIRKILKEESLKTVLLSQIEQDGWLETSKLVGGVDNLFKVLNIETPMEFLHLFDDLDVVQSEEKENWTLFRHISKQNLMAYNKKNKYVYINYDDIWSVLQNRFGLKHTEIQELTKRWLDEVYNLRGVTTLFDFIVV